MFNAVVDISKAALKKKKKIHASQHLLKKLYLVMASTLFVDHFST